MARKIKLSQSRAAVEKMAKSKRGRSATPTEADTQRAIISYLLAHPKVGMVIRFNSGAMQLDSRYIKFSHIYARGTLGKKMRLPDVYVILKNGLTMWIEIKREGWKCARNQREAEQQNFLRQVILCLNIGIFATCVEDVQAVLR